MVERARVVIVEDHDVIRETLADGLMYAGHEVVGVAADEASAAELIDGLRPGAVDAVILDGNYTEGQNGAEEGTRVAHEVQKKLGDVAIFDIGGDTPIRVEGITRLSKADGGILRRLLEALRDIPEPAQSETFQDEEEPAA